MLPENQINKVFQGILDQVIESMRKYRESKSDLESEKAFSAFKDEMNTFVESIKELELGSCT